jgi:hypothetical protein
MGVEANSQHLLDILGRRTAPEMNRQAVQLLLQIKQKLTLKIIATNLKVCKLPVKTP